MQNQIPFNAPFRRWEDPNKLKRIISKTLGEINETANQTKDQPPPTIKRYAFSSAIGAVILVIIFFAIVMTILSLIAEERPTWNFGFVALFAGGVSIVAFLVTYFVVKSLDARRANRILSFHEMAGVDQKLFALHETKIPVPSFPLLFNEDAGQQGHDVAKASAAGASDGKQFFWIEIMHTVDRLAHVQGGVATKAMVVAGAGGKQRRMVNRTADTIIFTKPLNLPDIMVSPNLDPLSGYTRNKFGKVGTEIDLPEINKPSFVHGKMGGFCVIASDPRAGNLFNEKLQELMKQHKKLAFQVFGGFVAVYKVFMTTLAWERVHTEDQIKDSLEVAKQVYDALEQSAANAGGAPVQTAPSSILPDPL